MYLGMAWLFFIPAGILVLSPAACVSIPLETTPPWFSIIPGGQRLVLQDIAERFLRGWIRRETRRDFGRIQSSSTRMEATSTRRTSVDIST